MIRFDTIRYCPPPPSKQKIQLTTAQCHDTINFCLKENHVHILGFDVTASSCYHFTSLGNNFSDGTDVPHVPGTPNYIT